MEVDFALLADRVSETLEGKLDIIGAGFDTIFAPEVPARHPRMGLAMRLVLTREELEEEHRVDITIRERNAGAFFAQAQILVPSMPNERRDAVARGELGLEGRAGLAVVVNFDGLVFHAFGMYEVEILWDGQEARESLPLRVAEAPGGQRQ